MKPGFSLAVIAGLDPAIHARHGRSKVAPHGPGWVDAVSLDRRVKPGDDSRVV